MQYIWTILEIYVMGGVKCHKWTYFRLFPIFEVLPLPDQLYWSYHATIDILTATNHISSILRLLAVHFVMHTIMYTIPNLTLRDFWTRYTLCDALHHALHHALHLMFCVFNTQGVFDGVLYVTTWFILQSTTYWKWIWCGFQKF